MIDVMNYDNPVSIPCFFLLLSSLTQVLSQLRLPSFTLDFIALPALTDWGKDSGLLQGVPLMLFSKRTLEPKLFKKCL
jgi:hypothetical protein